MPPVKKKKKTTTKTYKTSPTGFRKYRNMHVQISHTHTHVEGLRGLVGHVGVPVGSVLDYGFNYVLRHLIWLFNVGRNLFLLRWKREF